MILRKIEDIETAMQSGSEEVLGNHDFESQEQNFDLATKKRIIGATSLHTSPTRIAVMGVGGGGVNAVSSMVSESNKHVDLWAVNTDIQTLQSCPIENVIQLGANSCKGLGVGGNPERGAEAAREVRKDLEGVLSQYDMLFLASGLGGGTGTGAIPVIAELARDVGVLVVSVVTLPFHYEGEQRVKNAEAGLEILEEYTDALIVIPNNRILSASTVRSDICVEDSFLQVNKVLSDTVFSVTNILTKTGRINIDFADIRSCLKGSGLISVGFGESNIEESHGGNAHRATEMALKSKILSEENSEVLSYANYIIVNVVGGKSFPMQDYTAIADIISSRTNVKPSNLKQGYRYEASWNHKVQVTIIAASQLQKFTAQKVKKEEQRKEQIDMSYAPVMAGQAPAESKKEMPSQESLFAEQQAAQQGFVTSEMFSDMLKNSSSNLDEILDEEIAMHDDGKTAVERYHAFFETSEYTRNK